jgi:hypothetical protein
MLSFYHSQPTYSVFYPGGPRYTAYTPNPNPSSRPEVRYRRALAEYFSAEEEYEALLRAREQGKLRARVEEALRRQERAPVLRVEISRARREQQTRELERILGKALSGEEVPKDFRSFRHIAPVICRTSGRPRQDTLVFPLMHAHAEKESRESFRGIYAVQSPAEDTVCRRFNLFGLVSGLDLYDQPRPQHHANENPKDNKPQAFSSEPNEYSIPNLESLLRERLQKVVGDEEVQDVARAILRYLTPETGVGRSTKVRHHSVSSLTVSVLTTNP